MSSSGQCYVPFQSPYTKVLETSNSGWVGGLVEIWHHSRTTYDPVGEQHTSCSTIYIAKTQGSSIAQPIHFGLHSSGIRSAETVLTQSLERVLFYRTIPLLLPILCLSMLLPNVINTASWCVLSNRYCRMPDAEKRGHPDSNHKLTWHVSGMVARLAYSHVLVLSNKETFLHAIDTMYSISTWSVATLTPMFVAKEWVATVQLHVPIQSPIMRSLRLQQ